MSQPLDVDTANYVRATFGCLNEATCTESEHKHKLDRTLAGTRAFDIRRAPDAFESLSQPPDIKLVGAPVSFDTQTDALVDDILKTLVYFGRERFNAQHACLAQHASIERLYKQTCAKLDAADSQAVAEVRSVRDKRLANANASSLAVCDVVHQACSAKLSEIVRHAVSAGLVRASAQQVALLELLDCWRTLHEGSSVEQLADVVCKLVERERVAVKAPIKDAH